MVAKANGGVVSSGSDQDTGSEREEVNDDVGEVVVAGAQSCFSKAIPHEDAVHLNSFLQRQSKRVARNPCTYLCTLIFLAVALSAIGLIVGEFAIEVESAGWWSRGTLVSDRQRQTNLVRNQRFNLAYNMSAWDILMDPDVDHPSYETLLYSAPTVPDGMKELNQTGPDDAVDSPHLRTRALRSMQKLLERDEERRRRLDEEAPNKKNMLSGCDLGFYENLSSGNLWPIWRIPDKEYETTDTRSVLDADVLESICLAETNTQNYLEENSICHSDSRGCDTGRCIPPYSIVLYARLIVEGALDLAPDGGYAMDCKDLSLAWTPDIQEFVRDSWIEDIKNLKIVLTPGASDGDGDGEKEDPVYPYGYYPALVQSDFDTNGGRSQYTSSVFDTDGASGKDLLDAVENFDRASDSEGIVLGAYDTAQESMGEHFTDSLLGADMTLALASAVIISIAIMIHTQSPLITGLGLLQIVLSFPMGFFFYKLIFGFEYFPFLNFLGVFVVFSLGAGDIYVAFDKWTNYRKNNITKSTEYVAANALPESLGAMFLTTLTTALAFFATAVCPVAPVKMFAIFCGLLIIFDYILTVCFVFPGLCIYDRALIKRAAGQQTAWYAHCWMGCVGCGTCFPCCSKTVVYDDIAIAAHDSTSPETRVTNSSLTTAETDSTEDGKDYNRTQRLILKLSVYLQRARWPLLIVIVASLAVSCYYAIQLSLPDTSDVRLMKPSIQYEQSYMWRKELLASSLDDLAGSSNSVIFGLDPADTGIQSDPNDGTSLVLDETFDPSSEDAQLYLRGFCDNFFEEDFTMLPKENYVCPMNKFDQWLKDEALAIEPDPAYTSVCGSTNGLPVASDKFHACISAWALKYREFDILAWDGVVKYIRIAFRNRAVFTDPYDVLQEEWDNINDYLTTSNEYAPEGVNKAYFTSVTFHWHDTNGSIAQTAYGAAGISLGASAIIILLSSRSMILTLFSTVTIFYILVSVTAILVGLGWTLGFLESVCFSILIGVSVDFVIHFNHAYVHYKGEVPRTERSKYAMVTMGPSILSTAGTTFFSAVVMLFCRITFFNKFALVLFFTMIMATAASFIVFITLTNCFGPTDPTYFVDKCLSSCGVNVTARNQGKNESTEKYLTASKVRSLDE